MFPQGRTKIHDQCSILNLLCPISFTAVENDLQLDDNNKPIIRYNSSRNSQSSQIHEKILLRKIIVIGHS